MRALKRLSQNFLIDESISRRIVEAAGVGPSDTIIEIGPGLGALTRLLLETGARVIAIELDDRLIPQLRQLPGLELIHADALRIDFGQLATKAKLVANLPYHLTAPILEKIVTGGSISKATVMVQKEVALRCTAQPGTKAFGHLTLFLQFYSDLAYCFEVGRHCFDPVPGVDSAIIQLTPKAPPLTEGVEQFFKLTRAAMGQRRKMVRGTLGRLYPREQLLAALKSCKLTGEMRPEQISLTQFLALHAALSETA